MNNRVLENYLSEINGLEKAVRKGRNVYEGYQRGWGLQFADLKQKITNDPLYRDAFKTSKSRSIVMEDHRMNVYLIIKYFLANLPNGNIIEFGAYRGGNAIFMAYVINELYPGMKVFALDSFEGMPPTNKSVDAIALLFESVGAL